jgi:hypothetical protein
LFLERGINESLRVRSGPISKRGYDEVLAHRDVAQIATRKRELLSKIAETCEEPEKPFFDALVRHGGKAGGPR